MNIRKKARVKRSGRSQFRPRFEMLEHRHLLAGPEVDVLLGAQSIPAGETVDFGAAVEDSSARVRTFTVYNRGDQPLVLGGVNLPDGFRLKEGLSTTINARGSDTFTVEMLTDAAGVKSGGLWFSTNDADETPCYYSIGGEVTEPVLGGSDLDVVLVSRDMPTVWNGATVDFGTANLRGAGATMTFRVHNRGDQPLHLGTLKVPEGFRVTNGLIRTVAPGRHDEFSIAMKTDTLGVKSGTVRFGSDAAGDETFAFTLRGEVVKSGRAATVAASVLQAATSERAVVSKKPLVSSNPAWTWQSPNPPAQLVMDVYFLNAREGWMAAVGRGLMHTIDGGKSWSNVQFGPPMGFYSVYFADWQHGWAVGCDSNSWDYTESNIIWGTSDGGKTWQEQYRQPGYGLGRVVFANNMTGWAESANYIVATTDGGQTWNRMTLPAEFAGAKLIDMNAIGAQKIWILGYVHGEQDGKEITTSMVASTEDGGQTWSTSSLVKPRNTFMSHLAVVNKASVWIAGDFGYIYRFELNTNSWTEQPQPFGNDIPSKIVAIQFVTEIEGWTATEAGGVLHTIDGGRTWFVNSVIPRWNLTGLTFTSPTNGWLYGAHGVLYETTDGGLNWQDLRQGSASVLMSVSFPTASHGWAVGSEGTILSTKDSGRTWNPQASPVTTALCGVHFVNSQLGWAVGYNGTILNTRDGGRHWNVQSSSSASNLSSVYFASSKVGWAVGQDGTILNTLDGGVTWTPQRAGGGWALTDVRFCDRLHGWATSSVEGEWPVVLRTDDGGAHWTPVEVRIDSKFENPEGAVIGSVYFINPSVGWICGGFELADDVIGTILKTTDGGKTWQRQEFDDANKTRHMFKAIWFTDKNRGFAVGEHGQYYATIDGGVNWVRQVRACPGESVTDIVFANSKIGYMVGSGGAILQTTKGGM